MDAESLKRLADNPNFIAGIYNYCDRWCERCPFTARCMNFAMGEAEFADPASRDPHNEQFWETLAGSLQAAMALLHEMAEEQGIDLDALDPTDDEEEAREPFPGTRDHPGVRAATEYADQVDRWLDEAQPLFQQKEADLNLLVRLGVAEERQAATAVSIQDATEVARWYQHQIAVKLMRALHGRRDEARWGRGDFPSDADGSAKVALLGMDRSLAAWAELHRHSPEREDATLALLVTLDRLRRQTEAEFPQARAFVRPGFDTGELGASGG